MGVFETLKARGFFKQCTDEEKVRALLNSGKATVYVGVDPTGDSLHIGHIVPFFAFHHLQEGGNKVIVLLGEGTAMIGDPSGKTEMRKMLSKEQIASNSKKIISQLGRVVDFTRDTALTANNRDWLMELNYIDFLREIGKHFSVNKMLSFEAYKQRLEKGLSFIEFNYQLLQSYDFMVLNRDYDCNMQMGGDDQWGNIVAGVDLIRRTSGKEVFGLTFPLITRADGKKMGKSEKGAVFLDPNKFTPYEYFQYWRNVPDEDALRFLKMFTFLPLEEIAKYEHLQGQELNTVKELLAYEQTKIIHGEEEADKALSAAKSMFSAGAELDLEGMPSIEISKDELKGDFKVVDLYAMTDLCKSKSAARRLVEQGGAKINEEPVNDIEAVVAEEMIKDGQIILKAGKKRYFLVKVI